MPGIHDKNSKPLKLLDKAKFERALSNTALPAIITFFPSSEILLKSLLNLITTPSNKSSEIKVFEPAPRINIFSFLFNFLKNLISCLRLFAL